MSNLKKTAKYARVIKAVSPDKPEYLTAKVGDIVTLEEKKSDGWWKVSLLVSIGLIHEENMTILMSEESSKVKFNCLFKSNSILYSKKHLLLQLLPPLHLLL